MKNITWLLILGSIGIATHLLLSPGIPVVDKTGQEYLVWWLFVHHKFSEKDAKDFVLRLLMEGKIISSLEIQPVQEREREIQKAMNVILSLKSAGK